VAFGAHAAADRLIVVKGAMLDAAVHNAVPKIDTPVAARYCSMYEGRRRPAAGIEDPSILLSCLAEQAKPSSPQEQADV
jgi:hypothetical protein